MFIAPVGIEQMPLVSWHSITAKGGGGQGRLEARALRRRARRVLARLTNVHQICQTFIRSKGRTESSVQPSKKICVYFTVITGGMRMKKALAILAMVATVGATVVSAPAEARGFGRGFGGPGLAFGLAAGAIAAGAYGAYGPYGYGYGYGRGYGYGYPAYGYGPGPYAYYGGYGGGPYYRHRYWRHRHYW
jgi:hypothetical protein